MSGERTLKRLRMLESFGARPEDTPGLLEYNNPSFETAQAWTGRFPLADEPFVAAWKGYAATVAREGSLTALFPFLTELDPSMGATRAVTGADLKAPEKGCVFVHPTIAGGLPAIVAGSQRDFFVLVQTLAQRGIAVDLPASMGALFLGNYQNKYQHRQWKTLHPGQAAADVPKEKYQERFAMLRPGAYSGVPASSVGLSEAEWDKQSLQIRLEHECTHYFTRRVFGAVRINALDELLADFNALRKTIQRFNPDWQRLFLGLEEDGRYRQGGRLENYFPATLSAEARATLERLVQAAIGNLAEFDHIHPVVAGSTEDEAAVLVAIASTSLEELARVGAADKLKAFTTQWRARREAMVGNLEEQLI